MLYIFLFRYDISEHFDIERNSRWTTLDPLAEKYYSVSPYAFCFGNPVNFAIEREQKELAHFAEREQRKALQGLNFVDWDGMSVWVLDEQSRNNIVNTLTKEEAKYVKLYRIALKRTFRILTTMILMMGRNLEIIKKVWGCY